MANASNHPDQRDTFDADFKEDFNQGMLRMLREGSSNDVRIILSDGEITANKDVLAAQCKYFAANLRWKEKIKDGSDSIDNTDCSKEVMERIIKYLFTGSIKFKDLDILQLLELLNQVRKMLLKDDLQNLILAHLREDIFSLENLLNHSHDNLPTISKCTLCNNIIQGLKYVDKYVISIARPEFLLGIIMLLPRIAQDNGATSAFSTLPDEVVYDLFIRFNRVRNGQIWTPMKKKSYNSAQLRCILAWLDQNKDVYPKVKELLLSTIDLNFLPAADLFQLVKPSGLFHDDEVDKRIVQRLHERDAFHAELQPL